MFDVIWQDADGNVVDLTGGSVSVFEPHAALAGITAATTDALAGITTVRAEWDDAMPSGMVMNLRLRVNINGDAVTSPKIWVNVK